MNPTVPVAGVCMGGWAAATATGAEAGNANRNTYIHTYTHTRQRGTVESYKGSLQGC